MLTENSILQEAGLNDNDNNYYYNRTNETLNDIESKLDSIDINSDSDKNEVVDLLNTVSREMGKHRHDISAAQSLELSKRLDSMYDAYSQLGKDDLSRKQFDANMAARAHENQIKDAEYQLKKSEYELKKSREEREREIYRDEKERNKSKAGTGSYQALDSKIDIVPTSATVVTNVLYKGGPLNGKVMEDFEFNINVKVIPTIIKNFKVLENDLLNDYFTQKSENYFKSKGRSIARAAYNKLRSLPCGLGDAIWKFGMTVAGEDVDKESRKDIIYNTQGFVDASAFHKSGSSPNNYNYTSNIVIFNKDDLTDPDDANIFQNRSAMVKLFKMGWSTFAMLDPVEEMMYFISSLDGGYMHYVPYRYMMESYGSKAYYGTETKLRDSAKPFLIKRGNFGNFAKQFSIKRRK